MSEIYQPDTDFSKLSETELKAALFDARCITRRASCHAPAFVVMARQTREAIKAEIDKRKQAV